MWFVLSAINQRKEDNYQDHTSINLLDVKTVNKYSPNR